MGQPHRAMERCRSGVTTQGAEMLGNQELLVLTKKFRREKMHDGFPWRVVILKYQRDLIRNLNAVASLPSPSAPPSFSLPSRHHASLPSVR